jgi:hypothetical protein
MLYIKKINIKIKNLFPTGTSRQCPQVLLSFSIILHYVRASMTTLQTWKRSCLPPLGVVWLVEAYATSRKVPMRRTNCFSNLPNPSNRTRPWGLLSL